MTARPYLLAETTWHAVRDARYDVAVLPWGATEAHNYHLPYATDNLLAEGVAAEAARRATEKGARVIVLPAVPFGVQTGQLDIPLCLNLNPSTQALVLRDLVDSVARAGIQRLVVLNAHGGNSFKQIIRELQPQVDVLICALDWWRVFDAAAYFDEPGDHAGELETSVVMHLAPHLVRPLSEAGSGAERQPRLDALRKGWAWTPRRWTQVSADTGVGNPARSSAEKGARFFDDVAGEIAGFLVQLAATDPGDMYA